jgi:hypothetical protein
VSLIEPLRAHKLFNQYGRTKYSGVEYVRRVCVLFVFKKKMLLTISSFYNEPAQPKLARSQEWDSKKLFLNPTSTKISTKKYFCKRQKIMSSQSNSKQDSREIFKLQGDDDGGGGGGWQHLLLDLLFLLTIRYTEGYAH